MNPAICTDCAVGAGPEYGCAGRSVWMAASMASLMPWPGPAMGKVSGLSLLSWMVRAPVPRRPDIAPCTAGHISMQHECRRILKLLNLLPGKLPSPQCDDVVTDAEHLVAVDGTS